MNSNKSLIEKIQFHYESFWQTKASSLRWTKGPVNELPPVFSILEFSPTKQREMWTYATCGMSLRTDKQPMELHIFAPKQNHELVELLTVVAHYHITATALSLTDTVNFGRPWWPGSKCSYGLISLPYLDGPQLEWLKIDTTSIRFLWLIPITEEERNYKRMYGIEALERRLEEAGYNYVDPERASVV